MVVPLAHGGYGENFGRHVGGHRGFQCLQGACHMSLGAALADAQTLVSIAPHMALVPGFAIILTVLGLNLLGDGMRDYLDPRLRVVRT